MPAASPLGEFEVTILLAVLHLGDAATGAAVLDEILRRTDRSTGRGAVYVTLDRLEQKGLVNSRMDQTTPERGGHPRRFFKVTAPGLKRVRHAVSMLDKMRAGLDLILEQS